MARRSERSGMRVHLYVVLLVLAVMIAGCSGLAGEPRVIATIPPSTPLPTSVPDAGFPQQQPDIALGAAIFAENCTACHGEGGQGDGPLATSGQLAAPPADFTDPATASGQTPAEWFGTITNGRLEKLMPPWKDSLSEAERWAVALYTYTLSYQREQLEAGAALFGDDVDLGGLILADQSRMVNLSDAALAESLSADLSPEDRRALVTFMRSLSLASADLIGSPALQAAVTPEVEAATNDNEILGTVSGVVTNGTAGASVPPDLVVTLLILDLQGGETAFETTVQPDGSFRFEDVVIRAPQDYIVTTEYLGRVYGNGQGIDDTTLTDFDLPLTVYEVTDDASVIRINGLFTQLVATTNGLEVVQIIRFSNTSDRVYSVEKAGEDEPYTSVQVRLPDGITDLRFADTRPRFIFTDNPPTITDSVPVLPGDQHTVHVLYALPYDNGASIEQTVLYDLQGAVDVLLRPETVVFSSEQLAPRGQEVFNNRLYQIHGSELTLSAGETVRYSLSGAGTAEPSNPAVVDNVTAATPAPVLPIVLMVVGLVALLSGIGLYLRDRMSSRNGDSAARQKMREAFMEQIVQLDSAHEAGEIDDEAYRKLRDQLKAKLAEFMD